MRLDPRNGIFLWLVLAEMHTVLATWSRYCTPFIKSLGPHPRGICGNHLNELLSILCYAGYNRKRRDTDQFTNILEREGILIPRESAHSYLSKRSAYYEQGIVCECCFNRCSIRELRGYCRNATPGRYGLIKRSIENQDTSVVENQDKGVEDHDKSVENQDKGVEDHDKSVEDHDKSVEEQLKIVEQLPSVDDQSKSVEDQNKNLEDQIKSLDDQNRSVVGDQNKNVLEDQNKFQMHTNSRHKRFDNHLDWHD